MRDYRNLRVWDEAHRVTLAVYSVTQLFPREERFGLTSQARRAAASIAANLAEGCGRRSEGEKARFVQIAMGGGAELSYHLLLAKDLGFVTDESYEELNMRAGRVMKMLSALSGKLKSVRPEWRANSQKPTAKG